LNSLVESRSEDERGRRSYWAVDGIVARQEVVSLQVIWMLDMDR